MTSHRHRSIVLLASAFLCGFGRPGERNLQRGCCGRPVQHFSSPYAPDRFVRGQRCSRKHRQIRHYRHDRSRLLHLHRTPGHGADGRYRPFWYTDARAARRIFHRGSIRSGVYREPCNRHRCHGTSRLGPLRYRQYRRKPPAGDGYIEHELHRFHRSVTGGNVFVLGAGGKRGHSQL